MIHKKVRFKGQEYWYHSSSGIIINIYPLGFFSENGDFLANSFSNTSYATLVGEDILRFGEIIGKVSDLEEV